MTSEGLFWNSVGKSVIHGGYFAYPNLTVQTVPCTQSVHRDIEDRQGTGKILKGSIAPKGLTSTFLLPFLIS